MTELTPKIAQHARGDSCIEQRISTSSGCLNEALPVSVAAASIPDGKESPMPNADANRADLIRVALIDALRFSRDCLARAFRALNQGLTIIPFASIEECTLTEPGNFDVILYCGHDDGTFENVTLQHVRALRDKFYNVPVVVLSDAREAVRVRNIRRALDSGASGFVPTIATEFPAVLSAIRFVKDGGTFVPIDLMLSKREPRPTTDSDEPSNRLTPRQKTVLSHLRLGKQNKIIAYELGMTESTVKVHIRNIMRKTGATNRTQAVYNSQQLDAY